MHSQMCHCLARNQTRGVDAGRGLTQRQTPFPFVLGGSHPYAAVTHDVKYISYVQLGRRLEDVEGEFDSEIGNVETGEGFE